MAKAGARRDLLAAFGRLPPAEQAALFAALPPGERAALFRPRWPDNALPGQRPPPGDWRTWLLMAGRGFGKTWAGAQWIEHVARRTIRPLRIALVGSSIDEVRAVMVEGESGLLRAGNARWEPSRGQLRWPDGTIATAYSASHPEKLRGPQHHMAWCDELAKWPYAQATWDNLVLGLRLGERPRTLVTTTPRPVPLLRALLGDPAVAVTRGATGENPHLSADVRAGFHATYAATRLGRQELHGELIDDVEFALWTRDLLEASRARELPELVRVVVGVDPPAGTASGTGGDACGIVVCALGRDEMGYVIADASVVGASPQGWAHAVARAAARYGADRVVAEANNGGAMVGSVLRAADSGLPVTLVRASHGKSARAEPVALRYEAGRVRHLGAFPELEDELCGLVRGGGYEGPGRSPDRADACVWALTELLLGKAGGKPRIRSL